MLSGWISKVPWIFGSNYHGQIGDGCRYSSCFCGFNGYECTVKSEVNTEYIRTLHLLNLKQMQMEIINVFVGKNCTILIVQQWNNFIF